MVLSSAKASWHVSMPKALLRIFSNENWAQFCSNYMFLKYESLNLSSEVLNKQVEISQTKGVYSKLRSLMDYLFNKAWTSNNWAQIGQKRQFT